MEIKSVKFYHKLASKKRVAAYARVSSDKDAMLHSLSAQVSYYNAMIQSHPDWLFSGIYADEGISGTKDNRPEFQRLLSDAKAGKIDLIITKSISRFARNTVTLLKAVRELKECGVDIYFEEQNIHTLDAKGELVLTFLASFAQEEARSVSQNMKVRARMNFEQGKFYSITILGYRLKDGVLQIVPKEAEIVRIAYKLYLDGYGTQKIVDYLNDKGFKSRFGRSFTRRVIYEMLTNEVYTGKAVLQKTFMKNKETKKYAYNHGELTRWVVEDAHEAIIDKETFNKVQKEVARRKADHPQKVHEKAYGFSGMLVCGNCGSHYTRKKCREVFLWRCLVYDKGSARACISQSVPELELIRLTNEVLGINEFSEEVLRNKVKSILVGEEHLLRFNMIDGPQIDKFWIPKRKEVRKYVKSNSNSSIN